jgi:hypothetical protein
MSYYGAISLFRRALVHRARYEALVTIIRISLELPHLDCGFRTPQDGPSDSEFEVNVTVNILRVSPSREGAYVVIDFLALT